MTSKDFVYWLQGLFELSNPKTLNEKQVEMIRNHLKLVFINDIDPSYSDNEFVQQIFQNIHDGKDPLEGLKVVHTPRHNRPRPSKPIARC